MYLPKSIQLPLDGTAQPLSWFISLRDQMAPVVGRPFLHEAKGISLVMSTLALRKMSRINLYVLSSLQQVSTYLLALISALVIPRVLQVTQGQLAYSGSLILQQPPSCRILAHGISFSGCYSSIQSQVKRSENEEETCRQLVHTLFPIFAHLVLKDGVLQPCSLHMCKSEDAGHLLLMYCFHEFPVPLAYFSIWGINFSY